MASIQVATFLKQEGSEVLRVVMRALGIVFD